MARSKQSARMTCGKKAQPVSKKELNGAQFQASIQATPAPAAPAATCPIMDKINQFRNDLAALEKELDHFQAKEAQQWHDFAAAFVSNYNQVLTQFVVPAPVDEAEILSIELL